MPRFKFRKHKHTETAKPAEPSEAFNVYEWVPANRREARSAIGTGIMWFWDNDKKTLFGALLVCLVLLGGIYKGFGIDKYQPVIQEKMEAMTGVSVTPQSDSYDPSRSPFVFVQSRSDAQPIVVNGRQWGFYDSRVMLWKEWQQPNVILWTPGMDAPRRIKNVITETK